MLIYMLIFHFMLNLIVDFYATSKILLRISGHSRPAPSSIWCGAISVTAQPHLGEAQSHLGLPCSSYGARPIAAETGGGFQIFIMRYAPGRLVSAYPPRGRMFPGHPRIVPGVQAVCRHSSAVEQLIRNQ